MYKQAVIMTNQVMIVLRACPYISTIMILPQEQQEFKQKSVSFAVFFRFLSFGPAG